MSERHLSPLDLDLLATAGLNTGSPELEVAKTHVKNCGICAQAYAEREQAEKLFMQHAYGRGLARVQALQQVRRRRPFHYLWALAAPALLVMLFVAIRQGRPVSTSVGRAKQEALVGVKGASGFRVIARRGDLIFPVEEGQHMLPGDALRFVVEPSPYDYLMIASIDGEGRASIYFPFDGQGSAYVPSKVVLEAPEGSVVLDQAAGPERIFAIWSAAPIERGPVLSALTAVGMQGHEAIRETVKLNLPSTHQHSIYLEKARQP